MNRSLTLFLAFLLLLAGIVSVGVWWIGWDLLRLAFDGDRRAAPYGLLLLSRSAADDLGDHRRILELLAADGGEAVWQARSLSLVDGGLRDDWRRLTLVRFERGDGVTRALTGSAMRSALADRDRLRHPRRQVLGSAALARVPLAAVLPAERPPAEAPHPVAVVLLGLFARSQEMPVPAGELGFTAALEAYGARLLWQGAVTTLAAEVDWSQALLLGFPDSESAQRWLEDPRVETARALGARHYRHRVLLLAAPQPPAVTGNGPPNTP